jgi:hypothetical protein
MYDSEYDWIEVRGSTTAERAGEIPGCRRGINGLAGEFRSLQYVNPSPTPLTSCSEYSRQGMKDGRRSSVSRHPQHLSRPPARRWRNRQVGLAFVSELAGLNGHIYIGVTRARKQDDRKQGSCAGRQAHVPNSIFAAGESGAKRKRQLTTTKTEYRSR